MSSHNRRFGLSGDKFYPWLLAAAAILASATIWMTLHPSSFRALLDLRDIQFGKLLYWIPFALTFSFLALRILLAASYRPIPVKNNTKWPKIAVIIPAYNEGEQVLPTVRSVMASDYPASRMQVICIDDGSKDDTWAWLLQAKREFPQRLQLIRQPMNKGKRQALLAGFHKADAEVFITIDSDSEVEPNTLRHMVSPFVAQPKVGAVAGNIRVLNRGEGMIPKMMEVSFATAFDFIRSGQSVFGGVFCTPGAASAYRASVIRPHLDGWANQTFLGTPATIGEDRALTNRVLSSGFRVVYQREAVVWTKVPTTYGGLRRMLLRWARSNVRESLVLTTFIWKPFRKTGGTGLIRIFGLLQLLTLTLGEALKIGLALQLLVNPLSTISAMLCGALTTSIIPAMVHRQRYGGWFGWRWALPYTLFWLFTLSWISVWALLSASRSGWLTRSLPTETVPQADTAHQGIIG